MFVQRKTMDAALLEQELRHNERISEVLRRQGELLHEIAALQKQLADWITEKADALTPHQFATLFYSRDDTFQAEFFNVLSDVIQEFHDAIPEEQKKRGFYLGPGYPAGETQWCWMSYKLNDDGRATIEAMNWHAIAHHERIRAEQLALATGAAPAHTATVAQQEDLPNG